MQMPYRPSYFQLLGNAKQMQITVPDAVWIDYLGWDPNLVRVQPPNKQHI